MQLCEEVADGLNERGHEILILTSSQISGKDYQRDYPVYRLLSIDPDWESEQSAAKQFFLGRRARESHAIKDFHQIVDEHQPEIIFIWHAIGLPKSLLKEAENTESTTVVYYLADYQSEIGDEYMEYWKGSSENATVRVLKQPLSQLALAMLTREGKPIRLDYQNAICVSGYVRDRLVSGGYIPDTAVVIHNGVDLEEFSPPGNGRLLPADEQLRCLIAGRIIPNKGIHTVVDAFSLLDIGSLPRKVSLTIIGDGPEDYLDLLRDKIRQNELHNFIEFRSPVPRSQMPAILAEHEVLILASEYDEPLARAIQEAMALELLVIGTLTGGSGELLVHERTGLVFNPGDPKSLADQLDWAARNSVLVDDLREAGRREIEGHFNIQRTVLEVEQHLLGLIVGEMQGEH
jgi:glycosyltransferase involved in cell wall biosynthesis